MIFSKVGMFKDLEELQANGCQTDVCLVGAGGVKVSIHRAMLLLANHVQPHPVWQQLDPGEGDGKVMVIVPDASPLELETFVRRLYSPGEDVFFTAAQNTPVAVPGTPDVFHTAVPQTPFEPPTEFVDHSEMTKREKKQRLDMINVSLSLLRLQRNEAMTRNDKETAMKVMESMDLTLVERRKLENELEACDSSEDSSDVKDDDDSDNNNIMQEQFKIHH